MSDPVTMSVDIAGDEPVVVSLPVDQADVTVLER